MRFALFGSYGKGNVGDEAIADGIHKILKKIDFQTEVVLFSHDVEESKRLHSQFTAIRPMIATGVRSLLKQMKDGTWKESISCLKNCDYIIVGGGGIFHDQEIGQKGLSPLFIWWLRSILFRWLKKPMLIWAVGIGPIIYHKSNFFLKGILKRARFITVRDQYSADLVTQHAQLKATIVPDPVWGFFEPIQTPKASSTLGVNIRESTRLSKEALQKLLFSTLQDVIQKHSFTEIKLIPFALHNPDDRILMQEFLVDVKKEFQLPVSMVWGKSPQDVFALVSSCSYFVAMRFHSYIFASSAQVPCTLLSYSKKTDAISQYSVAEYLAQQKTAEGLWQDFFAKSKS